MATPRRPADLGVAGTVLWRGVAGKYELRADELRLLQTPRSRPT
jgi:hypothetical protein